MGRQSRPINLKLPAGMCGNTKLLCGKRHKNLSCRTDGCGYHIRTSGLPIQEKALLLEVSKLGVN